MQIQPVNIVGELYISGEGLSIGYVNDPEKTSNSFIKNIYKSKGINGEFLYKTGDLARWLPDGTVEFLSSLTYSNLKVFFNKDNAGIIDGRNQIYKLYPFNFYRI